MGRPCSLHIQLMTWEKGSLMVWQCVQFPFINKEEFLLNSSNIFLWNNPFSVALHLLLNFSPKDNTHNYTANLRFIILADGPPPKSSSAKSDIDYLCRHIKYSFFLEKATFEPQQPLFQWKQHLLQHRHSFSLETITPTAAKSNWLQHNKTIKMWRQNPAFAVGQCPMFWNLHTCCNCGTGWRAQETIKYHKHSFFCVS